MENLNIQLPWPGWRAVKYLGSGQFGQVYEIERTQAGITEHAAVKIVTRPKDESELEARYENGFDEESVAASYAEELQQYASEYRLMLEMKGQSNIISCDDFTLIEPDFATEITNMGTGETGPFAQILVNPDALQTRDTNSRMTYDNVMGRSFGWFRNENAANDKKLLIIGDSMMKAVNPYLALSFREIRCMDNYEVGDKLTDEFLQEYQPDLVLMEHYPSHLYNTQPFNFALQ